MSLPPKPRFERPLGRLRIDTEAVAECRDLAIEISAPIEELARTHTTVSIERACLRLIGVDGVVGEGTEAVPLPNLIVDRVREACGLERGVLIPFLHAVESGCGDVGAEAKRVAAGETPVAWPDDLDFEIAQIRAQREAQAAVDRIGDAATNREAVIERIGDASKPWFYEI